MRHLRRLLTVAAVVLVLLATLCSSFLADGDNDLDLELCMGCICEATTNCNLTFQCTRGLCGPFLISDIYWKEAERPVINGDNPARQGAFYRCVTEPYCAATTVRHYLAKYAQDCNADGIINCDDYARIHYMGGHQCFIDIQHLGYYRVYKECERSIQALVG